MAPDPSGPYPQLPDVQAPEPVFKRAEAKTLALEPLTPHLEAKWVSDIEHKEGWSKLDAIKDAFSDGFRAGARAFLETTASELDEWIEANPNEPIYTVRIPFAGLRWIKFTIRVKHIAGWLKRRLGTGDTA